MLPLLVIKREKSIGDKETNNLRKPSGFFFYGINIFFKFTALEQFSMGKHLLLEVYNVNFDLLNDTISLVETMKRGIERAKMTILNVYPHKFEPQGCTIVIALAESHVSCHSWPEEGCISIDVYTCGEKNPKLIALELLKYLDSYNYRLRELNR